MYYDCNFEELSETPSKEKCHEVVFQRTEQNNESRLVTMTVSIAFAIKMALTSTHPRCRL